MRCTNRTTLIFLSSTLVLLMGACNHLDSSQPVEDLSQPMVTSPLPTVSPGRSTPPDSIETPIEQSAPTATEIYQQALDAGHSAATISQSAESPDDWQLVISRWQEAIALLESLSSTSPNYAIAQSKIAEYRRNLTLAQQQATRPSTPEPTPLTITTKTVNQTPTSGDSEQSGTSESPSKEPQETSNVIKVPIKQRIGQTPVIEVTFNGKETFSMILDTKASHTVITQTLAKRLGIIPQGEMTTDTASAKNVKFALGQLESIAVGEAIQQNINVGIAGSDIEIGWLGQDFLGNYDVVIGENIVELHSINNQG